MADRPQLVLRLRPRQSKRLKLQSIIKRNVPDDVRHEQERIDAISFLAESKLIDIEEVNLEFNFLIKTRYETNDEGWISKLILGIQRDAWNLPSKCTLKFKMLVDLHLCCCKGLSETIELPNLKRLTFMACENQLLENYQPKIGNFPNLTSLSMIDCNLNSNNVSSWISFLSVLTQLNILVFDGPSDGGSIDVIVQILQDKSWSSDYLGALVIRNVDMTGIQLKTLLLDVLPRFVNLHLLHFDNNNIQSLQPISDALNERSGGQLSTSVTSFFNNIWMISLEKNPVLENIKNDDKETKAMLNCLRHFKRCYTITSNLLPSNSSQFDNQIRHALQLNRAGRILLEGGGTNLSLSVWPTVLKRAFDLSLLQTSTRRQVRPFERSLVVSNNYTTRERNIDVSVAYDLLRNGPIIQALSNKNNNKKKRKRESSSTSLVLSQSRRRQSSRLCHDHKPN